MRINPNLHLAYCTNIHRGEEWAQTLDSLERFTLAVRDRVCPDRPYGIGLRLSAQAARELSEPAALNSFRKWLAKHNCYVFTINGFPYGQFHGTRVKEQVYAPDWTAPERLEYTNRLFDLLVQLLPDECEGSVSTLPGSFKEFIVSAEQEAGLRANLWRCIDHLAELNRKSGKILHLGLEPEPLCYLETTAETVAFFEQMQADRPNDARLRQFLGVNYDTCHLAVEYEEPEPAFERLTRNGIKISKIHLSSALRAFPTPEVRRALAGFADDTYLHQVIQRGGGGEITRYKDLDAALQASAKIVQPLATEWRIHFHIPLHTPPAALFSNTSEHIVGVLKMLQRYPSVCHHLEMETYTWEVMPAGMKNRSVVEQLVSEYDWTLQHLVDCGLGVASALTTGLPAPG